MMRLFAPSAARWLMPLLLSVFMSGLVSMVSTVHAMGLLSMFSVALWLHWLQAWLFSWLIAFPVLLMVLPVVKRLTSWLTGATLSS